MTDSDDIFGNVISSYSRAQAIEDGVLIDLMAIAPDVCKQHFKYPVAVTAAVWEEMTSERGEDVGDMKGIIHDVLWMGHRFITKNINDSTKIFEVIIGCKKHSFKIVCGPCDNAEPVLTIMLPGED